ncbi:MAG TPA: ABC transporter ATP-binding protein [Candidatus Limnocylindrales bacterium]|nr:ABC transporter ATP-binding protein [Candidatus Limnocylindrales bacterium]
MSATAASGPAPASARSIAAGKTGVAGPIDNNGDIVIETLGLTRKFGDFTAVDDIAIRVERGTIFAFLGANGSGKTTTIRMLIGLLTPTSGSITVAGVDVIARPRRVREAIGYMGQKVSLYRGLSLHENVQFYGGLHGITGKDLEQKWGALRERFALGEEEKHLTDDLPGGIRQRAGLALAMLHSPAVLFLDEPTAGVDVGSRTLFWELIREQRRAGVTIFVTTHFLDEVDYCDRISFIDAGRIVVNSTPEGLRERWSEGYGAFCPVAADRTEAAARELEAAGWQTTTADGGLRLHAQVATTAMLEAITRAAAPGDAHRIQVVQPSMSEVFRRLIEHGASVKQNGATNGVQAGPLPARGSLQ